MADRSIKLLEFSGDERIDKMTVIEYISTVEMSQTAGGWTDEITAEKVKLKLTGDARTWLQNRINAGTPGLGAFDPDEVAGARPPGLKALLSGRFLPQNTAAEQERLRASLIQGEFESVHSFYDRVESVQFVLDMSFPDAFRQGQKASYDIVHNQLVQGSFIAGLREEINKHVTKTNVATLQEALDTAVAFERSCPTKTKPAKISGVNDTPRTGGIAAMDRSGGNSLREKGCWYCGFLGHQIKACRIKQGDESQGIFQEHATGYQPGRIGRGGSSRGGSNRGGQSSWTNQRGGGYSRGRGRGSGNRGTYRGRGGYIHGAGGGDYTDAPAAPPQQPQQPQQPQSPFVPQPQGFAPNGMQYTLQYPTLPPQNPMNGGMGALRFFPEN
jgi:hypothetical protein